MPISIQIEPRLERKLDKYCRERHTSKEAVTQRALEAFLDAIPEAKSNPFVGGEPGEDPETARESPQRLRPLIAGKRYREPPPELAGKMRILCDAQTLMEPATSEEDWDALP